MGWSGSLATRPESSGPAAGSRGGGGAAGILVLQQAWAPGWRITVDGAPRQSLRVGGVLLGAAVAAGDQQVTLRYRPDGWIAGQRMAIAGAALWLGLLLWARRRWRVLG